MSNPAISTSKCSHEDPFLGCMCRGLDSNSISYPAYSYWNSWTDWLYYHLVVHNSDPLVVANLLEPCIITILSTTVFPHLRYLPKAFLVLPYRKKVPTFCINFPNRSRLDQTLLYSMGLGNRRWHQHRSFVRRQSIIFHQHGRSQRDSSWRRCGRDLLLPWSRGDKARRAVGAALC